MRGGRVLQALLRPTVMVRFILTGLVGAIFENAVLYALVEAGALSALFAAAVGKEVATLTVFVINDMWTFKEVTGTQAPFTWRLVRSHLVRALGVIVSLLALYTVLRYTDLYFIAANIVGIGVGFIVNYALENLVTWKTHEAD